MITCHSRETGIGVTSVAWLFSADCRPMTTLFLARQSFGLRRTTGVTMPFFFPPLALSSFVTRVARFRDIASFHLQPHPLIPLVGVACSSSMTVQENRCPSTMPSRCFVFFLSNPQWNRASKLESWIKLPIGKRKYVAFQRKRIFYISFKQPHLTAWSNISFLLYRIANLFASILGKTMRYKWVCTNE